MSSSAKLFGKVFGAFYLAMGMIGFALSGVGGFVATHGETLTTAAVAFIAVARSRREALAHGDFGQADQSREHLPPSAR